MPRETTKALENSKIFRICIEEENRGKTYGFRVANIGTTLSFNFRLQNHQMVVVETEGSYTSQITLDSLDVHVGQSYSVLVTANQDDADYYIVASPKMFNTTDDSALVAKGVLNYSNSASSVTSPLPSGPDPFDIDFSVEQAKYIRDSLLLIYSIRHSGSYT